MCRQEGSATQEYTVIRSGRKTLALEVTREGQIIVRAPVRCPQAEITRFVDSHALWLQKALLRQAERRAAHPEPDETRKAQLIALAKAELPGKVAFLAKRMGVEPQGITITGARTRFGSCSGKDRLSFSWRLMDYPEAAVDYVVVHELAHIRQKNHSDKFYAQVAAVLPDWRQREKLLKG